MTRPARAGAKTTSVPPRAQRTDDESWGHDRGGATSISQISHIRHLSLMPFLEVAHISQHALNRPCPSLRRAHHWIAVLILHLRDSTATDWKKLECALKQPYCNLTSELGLRVISRPVAVPFRVFWCSKGLQQPKLPFRPSSPPTPSMFPCEVTSIRIPTNTAAQISRPS